MKSFTAFLLSCLLLFAPIFADEAPAAPAETPEEPHHILTNMPGPMEKVYTSVHFPPIASDNKFHPGDIVDALIVVGNEEANPIKITTVAGALTSPYDPSMYFQNFTDFSYNITLHPDEEWTVHYKFQADPRIEPRTFGMVLVVFYSDMLSGKNYSTTCFNSTFEFSDFPDKIDAKTFFTYLGVLAVVVLVAVFGYKPAKEMLTTTHKRRRQASAGAKVEKSEEEDWLANTAAATPRHASKSRSPQRRVSPPADQ